MLMVLTLTQFILNKALQVYLAHVRNKQLVVFINTQLFRLESLSKHLKFIQQQHLLYRMQCFQLFACIAFVYLRSKLVLSVQYTAANVLQLLWRYLVEIFFYKVQMKTFSSHLHIGLASTSLNLVRLKSSPARLLQLKAEIWFHLQRQSFGLVWFSCPYSLEILDGLLLEVCWRTGDMDVAVRQFLWLLSLRIWFQEAKQELCMEQRRSMGFPTRV